MGVVELRKTLQVACSSKEGDMHLRPDPDFQDFALDCIRLSNQEKSPRLRHRLLTLAREWMHAAMHQRGAGYNERVSNEWTQTQAGLGPIWTSVT
jgi:hypothetical protein